MESVTVIEGAAVPLDVSDIDTDQIIPAIWMKRIERTGFEDGLFEKWRQDPDFILNKPERKGANILIAGSNFGCGSSREHAPWALRDYGFKAVVAPSFADIFRNNLPNVGLVPVILNEHDVRLLMDATSQNSSLRVTVDLTAERVVSQEAGIDSPFEIDSKARYQLINGKDIIDLTLENEDEILEVEAKRPTWMPKTNGLIESTFEDAGIY